MDNKLIKSGNKSLDEEWALMEAALGKLTPARRQAAGRLIVALDLTGSRAESLVRARKATAQMFDAVKILGSVAVKLVYYRGDECKAGRWNDDPIAISRAMQELSCKSGMTQIARVLRVALNEKDKVSGVVFIGDHSEEDGYALDDLAEKLGKKGIPLFIFHEIADGDSGAHAARPIFERMAKMSGGVYSEFRPDSASVMKELLSTVAAFAVAGNECVKRIEASSPEAKHLKARLMLSEAKQ